MDERAIGECRERGFSVIRKVLTDKEISEIAAEALTLWDRQGALTAYNLRVGLRRDPSGKDILERLDPVSDISELFRNLAKDHRLVGLAEDFLKGAVIPLKDKLIYKWPGCSGYGLHRDEPYFGISGVPAKDMLSVYIAIDRADKENGAIQFYPTLRNRNLPSPPDEPRDIAEDAVSDTEPCCPSLHPGDVLIFDGIIPHKSDRNHSDRSRMMCTITYAPAKYSGCLEQYYTARLEQLVDERRHQYPGKFFFR